MRECATVAPKSCFRLEAAMCRDRSMATMGSDDLATRVRAASRAVAVAVSGRGFRSPAQAFDELARACDELGIDEWDSYGERGAVARLAMAALVGSCTTPA
jgi:hypothetical protein